MMRRGLLLLLVLGLAGCPEPQEPPPPGEEPVPPVTEVLETLGESELFPEAPGPDEGTRARRRMDIHQLSAALERATGGQQWTEEDGSSSFEALAATLGEPDHIERIDRDLEPSMLFVKFLGDAARAVCEDMKDADLAAPEAERLLLRHVTPEDDLQSNPEGVEANLRYLLLRFHSRDLPEGSAQLQPWLDLFEASLTPPVGEEPADPASAWRTVCVGLVIHPNFYSY